MYAQSNNSTKKCKISPAGPPGVKSWIRAWLLCPVLLHIAIHLTAFPKAIFLCSLMRHA